MYLQKNRHCGNERKWEPLGCSNMKMWPRATRIQQRMMDLQQVNQGLIYGIMGFIFSGGGQPLKVTIAYPKDILRLPLLYHQIQQGLHEYPERLRYLQASKLPSDTVILEMSPRGIMQQRLVTEEARKPIELHTGARTPSEFGSNFRMASIASLNWLITIPK